MNTPVPPTPPTPSPSGKPQPPVAHDAKLEATFNSALERPMEEREAYIAQACGDDTVLLADVRGLLAAHEDAGDFLKTEAPPASAIKAEVVRLKPEEAGDRIGPYKLREQIGEGGFGVVWVAEQEKPVRRRVALKIIKLGMDTREVIARFEQERQALAMMDHPNIAHVLDAGATQFGRPFFVMELVRGVKITEYCDEQQLSTQERIELFITVCQAVQHAHQKGIIHRDLKPSNILVTVNDGKAVPKVIDFGVAKATQGRLVEHTVYTQFQQMIGTPLYMSPEQADMTSLDVDTRSDIYALGVLLYELLTGRTPIDEATMRQAGLDEMRRIIREVDPPRPSLRLKTLAGDELTTTAKRRHVEPAKLPGALRGDLDWIVMKCLEKDRTRRYDTANGLALDLRRHLQNEVITARPPTTGYLLGKLIRRNKLAFAAAAAVTLALVLGIVASLWQAMRATQAEKQAHAEAQRATEAEKLAGKRLDESEEARAEAQAIAKFMSEVFGSPAPGGDGRNVTVVEALGNATKRLDADQSLPPERRARLQIHIAWTYESLGLHREGVPLVEKAAAYYRTARGPDHPETLMAMSQVVHLSRNAHRTDDAIKLGEETLERMRRVLGPEHGETLWLTLLLANAYDDAKRGKEALAVLEDLVPRMSRAVGANAPGTLWALGGLASSLHNAGRVEEAIPVYERVLAARRRRYGSLHPDTLWVAHQLAGSYYIVGRREEAIALAEEAASGLRKAMEPEHPWTKAAERHLVAWKAVRDGKPDPTPKPAPAETLSRAGKFTEAAQATREFIKSRGAELEAGTGRSATRERMILAATLLAAGDRDAYRVACAEAASHFKNTADPTQAEQLAKACLLVAESGVDAATLAAFVATAQSHADEHWMQLLNTLAEYRLGHWDAAADWATKMRANPKAPERGTAAAAAILAMAEHQRHHPAEARAALDAAKTVIAAHWPAGTDTNWYAWLIADLLAKEAEALMK